MNVQEYFLAVLYELSQTQTLMVCKFFIANYLIIINFLDPMTILASINFVIFLTELTGKEMAGN